MNARLPSLPDLQIERAQPRDHADVLDLLTQNKLPLDGLRDHWHTAIVARQDARIVGSAALEVYPDGALLRSVAVDPALQHHGVGRQLTDAAIQLGRDLGVRALYLLTTTAADYFPAFGFERIERDDVPASVKASVEFTSACPSSAIAMRKTL
jgi:amino-acid N-acetyltransferase